MNGEHAPRLERIEKRVDELHDKMDELAETEAENSTDIVWLKWAVRGLVASAAGLGGVAWSGLT
ncbi:hypothetical protein BRD56_08245 [Thermoplasmatales archaeon SW_10_69_26]|nr:MAG: hypothetical protein BRD56_08245 [Thermoplasmatales archaeon SW_10_69_26]